jgi:hypothetical protein
MAVPKAAMNENHRFEPGQYNVRSAGKVAPVKTESKTGAVQSRPHR